MAATITSSGTWSALQNANPTSAAPGAIVNESLATYRDGVEQRAASLGANYRTGFTSDQDGFQELNQFLTLMAANYSVSGRAAIAHTQLLLQAMLQQGSDKVEEQRIFTP